MASVACKSVETNGDNSENKPRPNFIIMLADDLGYGDLSCYNGLSQTPNLDKMANEGVRFTSFYAAASNCSPSRTGMLTGRSPFRNGMYSYRPENHKMHLRDSEVTIAEQLKKVGYQTVHLGKWHLGCLPQNVLLNHPQPNNQGFDYSYGTESNSRPSHHNPVNFVRNGEKLPMQPGYSCQLLADEAFLWLDKNYDSEQPFFMYIAFHEPHAKVAAPDDIKRKYAAHGKDATYLACIENMDIAVGRIMQKLKDMKIDENTMVVFASDNGSYRKGSNGELRALKSWLYEGGIRVPGIVRWPGQIKDRQEIHEPAGLVDLFPTLSTLANAGTPENVTLDGTNIYPLLTSGVFEREKPLSWFFYRTSPEIAIRQGDFMIMGKDHDSIPRTHSFSADDMEYVQSMQVRELEVYNLEEDVVQSSNIADKDANKEQLQLLQKKLEEIKNEGYHWQNLSNPNYPKKIKTDWKRYW